MELNVWAFASVLKAVSNQSQRHAVWAFYRDCPALCPVLTQVEDLAGCLLFRPLEVGCCWWVQRANLSGCHIKRGDLMSGSSDASCFWSRVAAESRFNWPNAIRLWLPVRCWVRCKMNTSGITQHYLEFNIVEVTQINGMKVNGVVPVTEWDYKSTESLNYITITKWTFQKCLRMNGIQD